MNFVHILIFFGALMNTACIQNILYSLGDALFFFMPVMVCICVHGSQEFPCRSKWEKIDLLCAWQFQSWIPNLILVLHKTRTRLYNAVRDYVTYMKPIKIIRRLFIDSFDHSLDHLIIHWSFIDSFEHSQIHLIIHGKLHLLSVHIHQFAVCTAASTIWQARVTSFCTGVRMIKCTWMQTWLAV